MHRCIVPPQLQPQKLLCKRAATSMPSQVADLRRATNHVHQILCHQLLVYTSHLCPSGTDLTRAEAIVLIILFYFSQQHVVLPLDPCGHEA